MTQRPPLPDRPYDDQDDEEMVDVDSPRSILENRSQLPARVQSHAQAAAVAATSITENFVTAFWRRDDEKGPCQYCGPQPPPHRSIEQSSHLAMPETVPIKKPADHQRGPQSADCWQHPQSTPASSKEAELEEKIKQLEANLASAPSADSVRALERSLQAEIAQKERAEAEIRQKNDDLDALRKRWKQAARELDKIRSQSQGFYQVTDNHLVELTTRLRYNIRNFAIQHFDGELKAKRPVIENPRLWDKYVRTTTAGSSDLERLLFSERRPSIIQAILWRFLVGQVFDNFRWPGEVGIPLRDMCLSLRPEGQYSDSTERIVPEEERKFQIWLANTTSMVLDAASRNGESDMFKAGNREKVKSLVDRVCNLVDQFATVRNPGYESELGHIVEEAIMLDQEICRQVARIEWDFPRSHGVTFDPKAMMLTTGKGIGKEGEKYSVRLAVCPGLKKRGKSNGDGFGAPPTLLLPTEVLCEFSS